MPRSSMDGKVTVVAGLLALLFASALGGRAMARNNIRDAFFQVYPDAEGTVLDTVPSHPTHCGVCHFDFSGGGMRNPYGALIEAALPYFPSNPAGRRQAVQSVEVVDADSDGFSTYVEVTDTTTFDNTPTFPGLSPALVGSVMSVDVSDIQGYLIPSTGVDTTPPEVTVITPNGGELLIGNLATTVEWIAADDSGIASVDMHLSEDGGVTYRVVAESMGTSGTYTWFPANRPTATARIRIIATDNWFNEGWDESDAVFTIESPEGGLVPTTLRDFDMPGSQPFDAGVLTLPMACRVCHGDYDPDAEPYRNWQGSMMSMASVDPLYEAAQTVANQDAPDSGDLCLRCHIPRGWLRGRSVPTSGAQMQELDKMGVSCDFCHRLVDPIYDPLYNPPEDEAVLAALEQVPSNFANGMYVVDPNGIRRGPFPDADLGHAILVSPFHREAAFCGTCHDVSNTAFEKDEFGNYVPNEFDAPAASFSSHVLMPIERTYSEWFYSAYNTPEGVYAPQFGGEKEYVSTCQDCHMRDVKAAGCVFEDAPIRDDLPLHDMTGGSTWLPGLLPPLYPDLDPDAVSAGIARAQYMLQNAALLDVVQDGATLAVTVENQTGHKLPTGYPEGRRMWLNVRFYDAGATLIGESGSYDAATGSLFGDSELKVYEAKPGLDEVTAPVVGVEPGPSFHFVLNNKIFKDNRIPPRGFTNESYASFGGTPVGHGYEDGQSWDVTEYAIPPAAASAEVTLYYQSTSREYVEFLRDENTTDDTGQTMYDLWVNNGRCPPELMVTATLALTGGGVVLGDLNCDGVADFGDINPFVLALSNPVAYAAAYPDCDIQAGDINEDGAVNFRDINPFVVLLAGGG